MSISTVTSESLQSELRRLLPSQQGFGTDITASDTIVPIIDLTSAAEGSNVPEFLQRAWDFTTNETSLTGAATGTIANTVGFWQVGVNAGFSIGTSTPPKIYITDGLSNKTIWSVTGNGTNSVATAENSSYVFVAFLNAGESIIGQSFATQKLIAWSRQIADSNGTLINPVGFTPQ